MIIRLAKDSEMEQIRTIAEKFNLDSENMPAEEFFVAEENNKIIGFGRLILYHGFCELAALGVVLDKQRCGIGSQLVKRLIQQSENCPIYLRTIIPEYFEKFGFKWVESAPKELRKDPEWCEGCTAPAKCAAMLYEYS